MAYDPSLFTTSNKSVGIAQGVPTDGRSWFYDPLDAFTPRVFNDKAEVILYMADHELRKGHVSYFYMEGGTVREGWWANGIEDADFVEKGTGVIFTNDLFI